MKVIPANGVEILMKLVLLTWFQLPEAGKGWLSAVTEPEGEVLCGLSVPENVQLAGV